MTPPRAWLMLRRLIDHVRTLARRRRIEAETEEELQFHIDMETELHQARGLSADEARRAALRDFGGVTQAREGVRAVRASRIESWWQDTRYATRLWRRQPGFTAVALLTLAVGIGATTAIASAAYGVLLRPLPVRDEASLSIGYTRRSAGPIQNNPISWPAFEAWRQSQVFDDLAAVTSARAELTDGVAERISIQKVTGNFFRVLGVKAAAGRLFSEADGGGSETPAVISDALWRSRFSGDPNIIGKQLRAGEYHVTVVGVLPKRVDRWRGSTQMWIPIDGTVPARELGRNYHLFTPVARVAAGRSSEAADRLTSITSKIDRRLTGVRLVPLREDVSSPRLKRILLIMFAGVCLTWLVVCANLSNLLLARGAARASELTIRLAVGATRSRIMRQLLTESAVLAVSGGFLGVWVAFAAVQAVASGGSVGALNAGDMELTAPVLVFACLITIASVLACGIVPAATAGRASLARGAALDIGRASRRWSGLLVMAEIAVGLVVLVSAALLVKSVGRINNVDLGFDSRQVLTFQVILPTTRYGVITSIDDDRYLMAQRELLSRLTALPGVERASFGGTVFSPGRSGGTSLTLDDGREFLNGEPRHAAFIPGLNFVGPDYFAVHGVPVVLGREFAPGDDFGAQRVVVINQAMAALFWPQQNPIGKRLSFGDSSHKRATDQPWAEIIGIVANVRHGGIDVPARPYVYRAAMQYPRQEFDVMLRTSVEPGGLASVARDTVHDFDATVPMFATRTLADVVEDASADVRHGSTLLATHATLTVVLAGVGIFSVLAYVVAAGRRDLAIRIALGAMPAALARSVMRHALSMLAPGVLIGVAGAFLAAGSLKAVLYEVEPTDPAVFLGATLAVIAVAFLAAFVPARRAAKVDPVSALKSE